MKDYQVEILVKELKEIQRKIHLVDLTVWMLMGAFVGAYIANSM